MLNQTNCFIYIDTIEYLWVRAQDRLTCTRSSHKIVIVYIAIYLYFIISITRHKYWSFNFTILIIFNQRDREFEGLQIRKVGCTLFSFFHYSSPRVRSILINNDLTNISFYQFYATFNIIFNYIRYYTRQTSFRFKINTWKVILRVARNFILLPELELTDKWKTMIAVIIPSDKFLITNVFFTLTIVLR